jgi:hypothetical protein
MILNTKLWKKLVQKSEFHYDRGSVGQSVLLTDPHHVGSMTIFYYHTFADVYCRTPSLTRKRVFVAIATGPRQRSNSRVRVPQEPCWDSYNPEGQILVFITPWNRGGGQFTPSSHWVLHHVSFFISLPIEYLQYRKHKNHCIQQYYCWVYICCRGRVCRYLI